MNFFSQSSHVSILGQFDCFQSEFQEFRRDVHLLILGTLDAAKTYLSGELAEEVAKIESAMEKAPGGYEEHLADQLDELRMYYSDQERFVRNMAVVALASRLTHALRQMARSAEAFSRRQKRYGGNDKSEFQRLWAEYSARFGMDFNTNDHRIAFIEPMRAVRNQIVHEGGHANPFKSLDDLDVDDHFDDMLDLSFSKQYPEFVQSQTYNAEVMVSEVQLESMIKSSVELVEWCAHELRMQELAAATKDDDAVARTN